MTDPRTTRRAILAGLGATIAAPAMALDAGNAVRPLLRSAAAAASTGPVASEVGAIIDDARLGGQVAFAVADAHTGTLIEARSQLTPMQPASVTKTVTTLYALDRLGADYQFSTKLIATGPIDQGLVQGDLVLAASGDPTLDSDNLGEMAKALHDAGVTGVKGRFLVWEPPFPAVSWIDPTQPFQVSYNPGIGGLNLNLNRVHFEWTRQAKDKYQVTMEARGARYSPAVDTSTMELVDRSAPVYGFKRADGIDHWTVARGALSKHGARWLPVRAPGDYALDALKVILASEGIKVPTPVRVPTLPAGDVIHDHQSAPLTDILRYMLKESINVTAEIVGLSSTIAGGGQPTSLRDSAGQMCDWLRSVSEAQAPGFIDHSGLNDNNQVTPHDLVAALKYAGPGGELARLMKPWYFRTAKGGEDRANPVKMTAKTGTLNFVSSLAGFIEPPEGRALAFAIFCKNDDLRDGLSRAERERPRGNRSWVRRSRILQDKLLKRWTTLYC
jgi:D-alanyl-D-alanine carboxypeptidase/D-alanyl-D-alanine-endopeptidase (penicillin-binding protein 4)